MPVAPARIVRQTAHTVPGEQPPGSLLVTEHIFDVPLDHSIPDAERIRVFARSVKKHDKPVDPPDDTDSKKKEQQPWLAYFQGGPGFECRAPWSAARTRALLDKGYQMLFLDQRGTGLSTPVSVETLRLRGEVGAQVEYLKLFRADNIVRDAEAIRLALTADFPAHKQAWSVIGQSFGGFCCVTYLSLFPHALREAFLFGGLPPMVTNPEEVYRRLYKKLAERNAAYYRKYPEDVEVVKSVLTFIKNSKPMLPSGVTLDTRRFLQMGHVFGFHGGLDSVHETVLRTASEIEQFGFLTRQTLDIIDRSMPYDNNLIYSVLHEPIYCQGERSHWAAHRVQWEIPAFNPPPGQKPDKLYFTGEMIYQWMFMDTYAELTKLFGVAQALADDVVDWPALYDLPTLERNEVPVYAAVYVDDMYVDFDFSMETAGMIRGCKTYVTNVMYHDAIGSKADEVVEALWKLRCDSID